MPANQYRILIIDDEPGMIDLLLSHCSEQELDILVARNGEDGLAMAVSGHPDLILLDIVMPGMDGYAVCQRLKADPGTASVPVVFLSGRTTIEDKLRGFALGGVDYITKPFSPEEALARINLHIRQHLDRARLEAMLAGQALGYVSDVQHHQDRLFKASVRLMQQRLTDPPCVTELAHGFGISERKLTEIFRQRTGLSVFEYLTELRLETARHLLENSRLQVQLISERVGYLNPGDFTRAFRRRYSRTPRQCRHAQQGGEGEPG